MPPELLAVILLIALGVGWASHTLTRSAVTATRELGPRELRLAVLDALHRLHTLAHIYDFFDHTPRSRRSLRWFRRRELFGPWDHAYQPATRQWSAAFTHEQRVTLQAVHEAVEAARERYLRLERAFVAFKEPPPDAEPFEGTAESRALAIAADTALQGIHQERHSAA